MRCKTFFRACALAACVWLAGAAASGDVGLAGAGQETPKQEQGKDNKQGPKLPPDEAKAANKIITATDAAGKLAASAEFLKKYPKSEVRRQVAEHVAAHVSAVQDAGQRITLGEQYTAVFNGPGEADLVAGPVLDAYITTERNADAFRAGAAYLQAHPDEVGVMRSLAVAAGNAAIKGNTEYVAQGRQYAAKAAELIEADKKPAAWEAAQWAEYKTKWLPAIYREAGVLAMRAGDSAASKANMEKAAALKSTDPVVYIILSDAANQEYSAAARAYQAMPAGAEKTARLKEVEGLLDRVIEVSAQAVAMMEGNAQYDAARQQIRQDLEGYYKYRRGSTQGLQELIDKYKKP
ncbi:MAG TPA: hypothetical protein VF064_11140, partial [Pyrinomonadaceae bacterium]